MDVERPPKCRVRLEESGGELTLWRRSGSVATSAFLVFWLAGWTVGCVVLITTVASQPTLEHVLFAIPFWVSWVFVVLLLFGMLFGYEHLRAGPYELEYRSLLARRLVPLEEVRGVGPYSRVVGGEHHDTEHGVRIETLGRPVRYAVGLDEAGALWVAGRLHRHLQALVRDRTIEYQTGSGARPGGPVDVLRHGLTPAGPPSDSRLRARDDWDGLTITRRGAISLTNLGVVTFFCLFWNGTVSVFAAHVVEHFEWGLFLFLIPFAAVGLALFVAWGVNLTAPIRVERWTVARDGVAARASVLGIGRTRWVDAADVVRVEGRTGDRGRLASPNAGQTQEDDTPFSVVLVGRDGRDLLVVCGLTGGEARWLGGAACDALKDSLPKDSPPPSPAPLLDRRLDG